MNRWRNYVTYCLPVVGPRKARPLARALTYILCTHAHRIHTMTTLHKNYYYNTGPLVPANLVRRDNGTLNMAPMKRNTSPSTFVTTWFGRIMWLSPKTILNIWTLIRDGITQYRIPRMFHTIPSHPCSTRALYTVTCNKSRIIVPLPILHVNALLACTGSYLHGWVDHDTLKYVKIITFTAYIHQFYTNKCYMLLLNNFKQYRPSV